MNYSICSSVDNNSVYSNNSSVGSCNSSHITSSSSSQPTVSVTIHSNLSNDAYIDQLNRKIQIMNEEMLNIHNLYNIKLDIMTQEFDKQNVSHLKEIESLKEQIIDLESALEESPRNNKKRKSLTHTETNTNDRNEFDSSVEETIMSHCSHNSQMPGFAFHATTMTPSPVHTPQDSFNMNLINKNNNNNLGINKGNTASKSLINGLKSHTLDKSGINMIDTYLNDESESETSNESEEEATTTLELRLRQKFNSWTKGGSFANNTTHSAMTPSPPNTPPQHQESVEKKENELLNNNNIESFGHISNTSSNIEIDIRELEEAKRQAMLDFSAMMEASSSSDDDEIDEKNGAITNNSNNIDENGNIVVIPGHAHQLSIGHFSFVVSDGAMTPPKWD